MDVLVGDVVMFQVSNLTPGATGSCLCSALGPGHVLQTQLRLRKHEFSQGYTLEDLTAGTYMTLPIWRKESLPSKPPGNYVPAVHL